MWQRGRVIDPDTPGFGLLLWVSGKPVAGWATCFQHPEQPRLVKNWHKTHLQLLDGKPAYLDCQAVELHAEFSEDDPAPELLEVWAYSTALHW